jgi:glucokinase
VVGAIDIGGTKIAVGIVNSDGEVLFRLESATEGDGPYQSALDRTVDMLRRAVAKTGAKLEGIGVGSTGPVYPSTGEIGDVSFFPHWRGQNPVTDLKKIFGVPAAMENDANAAALGEAGWGSGKNKSRLIYVTVGTGIGVGVVLDAASTAERTRPILKLVIMSSMLPARFAYAVFGDAGNPWRLVRQWSVGWKVMLPQTIRTVLN